MSNVTGSITERQNEALKRVDEYMVRSAEAESPREAADWSLAAKNAIGVAVSCESILKMRRGGR